MQSVAVSHTMLAGLALALVLAAYTDIRRRQIDNALNAGVALAAPLFWWASQMGLAEIGGQLALALGAFVVLAGLFALGAMGGGDVKLLAALALWIKPAWFAQLVMVMAVAGGVLSVAMGAWHVARRHRERLVIPYGMAIAFGGLWVLGANYFPSFTKGFGTG